VEHDVVAGGFPAAEGSSSLRHVHLRSMPVHGNREDLKDKLKKRKKRRVDEIRNTVFPVSPIFQNTVLNSAKMEHRIL
jgi:hypothetical protein